jgi:hypothetical protein
LLHVQLGLPTFIAGLATALLVLICAKSGPMEIIKTTPWGVLPLVAGLFVLVEALEKRPDASPPTCCAPASTTRQRSPSGRPAA